MTSRKDDACYKRVDSMIYHELPEANPIESVLNEQRVFPPTRSFAAAAHIKSLAQYRQMYQESIRRPDRFWARQAKAELVWFKPWKKVMHWKEPYVRWFEGGQLNVAYNCL